MWDVIVLISDHCLSIYFEANHYFIAGRPKAALLFLFFGGFGCGVWLLIVLLVRELRLFLPTLLVPVIILQILGSSFPNSK